MDIKIPINNDWIFCKKYSEEMMGISFDGGLKVRLPHNACELPFSYCNDSDYQMICGYRYVLHAPSEWAEQCVRITFEGAAHQSVLYLNGVPVAEHRCGYTAFTTDLSRHLLFGKDNVLVLRLDSREKQVPPFGNVIDYLTYSGIYREVSLQITPKTYIDNVFVQTPQALPEKSHIHADISLTLEHNHAFVHAYLLDSRDALVHDFGEQAACSKVSFDAQIDNAELWTCDTPALYTLRVLMLRGGVELCRVDTRFGFRTCYFDKDGFYLNGVRTKLLGLNRHQSYPYVGYAMPKRAQRQDAIILKTELGLNAVRTSHYPQSQHFVDACDELGLLVFTEIPGWQHIGNAEWRRQTVRNVRDMVMQYRNHPSIILWGVRINESRDDDELYTETNAEAHKLDGTRQTGGVRCIPNSNLLEDVYTYNDFAHNGSNKGLCEKAEITSDLERGYLVSEYGGHTYPTKSYDDERHRCEHALRHARVINDAQKDGIAGSFGWCAFDYNTHKEFGSGDGICHHGVMDMFRNAKPAAHVYKSQSDDNNVLFITSEMNIGDHPVDGIANVYALTNADSVRLYKDNELIADLNPSADYPLLKHAPIRCNDFTGDLLIKHEGMDYKTSEQVKRALLSIAKYGKDRLPLREKLNVARLMVFKKITAERGIELFSKYMASWGGSAICYRFDAIKNGEVVNSIKKEPVYKTRLIAEPDSLALHDASTYDIVSIRLRAVDQNGATLYYCFDAVELEVDGALEIVGPRCTSLRGGMGGTYLKTTGQSGTARVRFKAACGECHLSFNITIN